MLTLITNCSILLVIVISYTVVKMNSEHLGAVLTNAHIFRLSHVVHQAGNCASGPLPVDSKYYTPLSCRLWTL